MKKKTKKKRDRRTPLQIRMHNAHKNVHDQLMEENVIVLENGRAYRDNEGIIWDLVGMMTMHIVDLYDKVEKLEKAMK